MQWRVIVAVTYVHQLQAARVIEEDLEGEQEEFKNYQQRIKMVKEVLKLGMDIPPHFSITLKHIIIKQFSPHSHLQRLLVALLGTPEHCSLVILVYGIHIGTSLQQGLQGRRVAATCRQQQGCEGVPEGGQGVSVCKNE